jgi:membrane-associated phospholipid phosphatase
VASLDERILRVARTTGHDPRAERAVAHFSRLGEHGAIWIVLGLLRAALERSDVKRQAWCRATELVAGAYVANTALKLVVRRRRPRLAGLPPLTGTPTQLSFPSAHATTSFVAAGLYSRLGAPPAPLYGLAAALALSRLYLGVHHPSDVLGGAALGAALASAGGRRSVGAELLR